MNKSTSGGGESSDQPPQSYRLTPDLAEELGLSEGQILRTHVVRRLPDDRDKILLNVLGNNVLAQTKIAVQPGDSLIVRVNSLNHPIELSIYDPEQIGEQLSRNRLSDLLDRMGFPRSEKILTLARRLIERRVYLHPELIRSALDCWRHLVDSEGEIDPSRMEAFLFLYRNKLPRVPALLRRLESLPNREEAVEAWRAVLDEREGDQRHVMTPPPDASQLREVLQRLGVDLVRRIGRRPHRASRTLHARLLADESPSPDQNTLLTRLLGLALRNLAPDEERRLELPFRDSRNRSISFLELAWKPGESPGGPRGTFRGTLEGVVDLSKVGRVGFRLKPLGDGNAELSLRSNDPGTCKSLREAGERLRKNLEKLGLTITLQVAEETPEFPDLFRSEAGKQPPIPGGGVNLLA